MNQTNKHVTVKDIIGNIIGNVRLEYTENDEFYNTCVTIKFYQGDSEMLLFLSVNHTRYFLN